MAAADNSGWITGGCVLLGGAAGFLGAALLSKVTGEKASDSPLTGLGIFFGLLGGAAVGSSISSPKTS